MSRRAADIVVAIALDTNPAATFSKKSIVEMVSIFDKENLTTTEKLREVVHPLIDTIRKMVRRMDDFQLRNAGSALAASLPGMLLNASLRKKETDRKVVNA